ncbi:MAG: gephyrin-like molybdotransferase Glp [Pseudomonadota bacterium]
MSRLLSVADALSRILADTCPLSAEDVAIEDAAGRILASDLTARRDQPAFDASAMDGYALRSADVHGVPTNLTLVGESAAGHPFTGTVSRGQCVRIFTGARLPDGADTIAIQENVRANGTDIFIDKAEQSGRYIRRAGLDYRAGDVLLRDGMKLSPARLSLAASMGLPALPVRRKPKVAIIASGDELVAPGEDVPEGGIVSSNNFGIAALVRAAGGEPLDFGIAPDTREALAEKFVLAADCHIVVTSGGASVGDHDLVRPVLEEHGVKLDFWKIAMRPGKPLIFGRKGEQRYLGLPGNPVSSLVCSQVYLVPLIKSLLGEPTSSNVVDGVLGSDLPENDEREEYMRAIFKDGRLHPFDNQDSSMLSSLARAEALLIRPAHAPAASAGEECRYIKVVSGADL